MNIEKNQIWQVCDSRIKRFVKILDDGKECAKVKIVTVFTNNLRNGIQPKIEQISDGVPSYAQHVRFGDPKGYRLIANSVEEFLKGDNEYTRQEKSAREAMAPSKLMPVASAPMSSAVAPGQIWMSNDSRSLRFVEVKGLSLGDRAATIRTLYQSIRKGHPVACVDHLNTLSSIDRFNGKSKGYTFVAADVDDFKAQGFEGIKYKGLKWSEVLADYSKERKSAEAAAEVVDVKAPLPKAVAQEIPVVVDQVWRSNDSRSLRYVLIVSESVRWVENEPTVEISTLFTTSSHGEQVQFANATKVQRAAISRFNGTSKGYSLVAKNIEEFHALGLNRAIYDKNASWALAPKIADEVVERVISIHVPDVKKPKAKRNVEIEKARELVGAKQLWQERTDHPHFVEVQGTQGDYALVVTRFIGKNPNDRPEFSKAGRTYEIRLDEFLPEKRKYHLVSNL
jgi:hypothetical protein